MNWAEDDHGVLLLSRADALTVTRARAGKPRIETVMLESSSADRGRTLIVGCRTTAFDEAEQAVHAATTNKLAAAAPLTRTKITLARAAPAWAGPVSRAG